MTNEREALKLALSQLRVLGVFAATKLSAAEATIQSAVLEKVEAALSQPSPALPNSEMWRHKKSGGIYAWVMTVVREDDQKVLVVYRGVNDGVRWARPASEFYDGRFERVDTADQPTEPAQPTTQPPPAVPTRARALRDGEVMGAYMDFDRTANRAWTSAEYIVHFGVYVSQRTVAALSQPSPAVPVLHALIRSNGSGFVTYDGVPLVSENVVRPFEAGQVPMPLYAAPQPAEPAAEPMVSIDQIAVFTGWKASAIYKRLGNRADQWTLNEWVSAFDIINAILTATPASSPTEQPATQAGAGERCQHCIDRHDGFYGSYAPSCPVHDDDGKLRATPTTEQPGDADTVELIVRGCCETDPADPDQHNTICISVSDLRGVLQSHLDAARAAHGKGGQG
jgi:hypothetical protein